ncbi:snurportin-1 [Bactrocera dorsalis]|uniref:Snurportin-1 n=1 Tax=Bactrocera dorsalis TaxID=27457 RepID=A0A6I9V0T5_BACDO|nr:snurportin-1 [Bactrocera dorsalis]
MFRNLYKQSGKVITELQEERRRKLLEEQKRNRLLLQDLKRGIDFSDEHNEERKQSAPIKKSSRALQDADGTEYSLQLSEWLRERPENIDDWILVPCPKGQRCLVVTYSGRTEMYTKAGRRRMYFPSLLPGGSGPRGSKMSTILDCVYSAGEDTFYVLDALVYGNQELVHCEAQFRFFWLRSKFEECPELCVTNSYNKKSFKYLPRYDFENVADISEAFQRYPFWSENIPQLDGWLFYHKESSYTYGTTPLVGWLFAFMVPDILGIEVNENYERPIDYSDPIIYMDDFDAKLAGLKHKHSTKSSYTTESNSLDTIEIDDEENMDDGDNAELFKVLNEERKLEIGEPYYRLQVCEEELLQ